MGFLSSLFTTDKKERIAELNRQIENFKDIIQTQKANMASKRKINAAQHYQESGKKNIETYKNRIAACKDEISLLKKI